MEHILLPTKIEYTNGSKPHETILTIEPLYPGYGLTVGNALRRILLSSLPGGAVVAVKMKGVGHEFSTIPYVKEDVVDILLNVKKLRFKMYSDEQVRLTLRVKGEKEVTGADIETSNEAVVANPENVLCTLTNKNAQLEIDFFVKRGRGYLPTETREKEKLELGTIAVDALFTPVRTVGMKIENVRVGQMTNYNRVVLTIETDGSITAQEAVKEASKVLVDHFNLFGGLESVSVAQPLASQKDDSSDDDFSSEEEQKEEGDENVGIEEKKEPKKRGRPRKTTLSLGDDETL